jgi:hypothetical protein
MLCTLLIPYLFWPRETAGQVLHGLDLPGLTRLVSRARAERYPPLTSDAWLCQAFEVEKQHDWPVAPLTLNVDGGDPSYQYWLRADPVHLRLERERLVLMDSSVFDITEDEAHAIGAALNAQFSRDGIVFDIRAPKRWYVKIAKTPELVTRSISEVAGRDVQRNLPMGTDALVWHRVFNEAQMLLHGHAINQARERRGEPPVNSVWFWGGGTRPAVRGRHFNAVWTDDPLALSLAICADASVHDVPTDAGAWMSSARDASDARSEHLIVINDLVPAARYRDAESWRSRLLQLETSWIRPLIEAVSAGALTRLTLVAPSAASCWRFEIGRRDLLKFWRGAKPLAAYA